MTIRETGLGNGTHTKNFADHRQSGTVHTIEFEVKDGDGARATPAAGTVTIKVKTPGGFNYVSPVLAQVDLTSEENWLQALTGVHVSAIELTVADLSTDHTLSYAISSSFGGA